MDSVKFFSSAAGESDDEDDEEEEVDQDLVQRLLKDYTALASGGGGDDVGSLNDGIDSSVVLSEARCRLQSALSEGQMCLVCLEVVGRDQPIWNCAQCYEIYHLVCLQNWAEQALQLANYRAETAVWHCPKCRREYGVSEKPADYKCFCDSTRNPADERWLAPHSCGQLCKKALDESGRCPHRCLLLCHPGPCPSCPKMVRVRCYCGRSAEVTRRCGARGWSCGGKCGALLDCGCHRCPLDCHEGDCGICRREADFSCRCGKSKARLPCSQRVWSCDQVCGGRLACEKHSCQQVCHEGDCRPCVRAGESSCPCGKRRYFGAAGKLALLCVDELPCCGDTCAEPLACGLHPCFQQCHRGPCPPCTMEVLKRCRCGQKQRTMVCSKEFLCDSKCRRKRRCGRHPCSKRCCDGPCPPCEQTCGRLLNCGAHRCSAACHPTLCYPCPQIAEVTCRCGKTKVRVACGRRKSTRPPRCSLACSLPADCHHEQRQVHRCHQGRCPPCQLRCDKPLVGCQHRCPLVCHSAVLTDVNAPKSAPSTPWERQPARFELVCRPCVPCRAPVAKRCLGEHENTEMLCSELSDYGCGRPCDRPLACGQHRCTRICHAVGSPDCLECEAMCDRPRPDGCSHICPQLCHRDECPPCRQLVKVLCHCGLNSIYVSCSWLTAPQSKEQNEWRERLSCGNHCPKRLVCGHQCQNLCHPAEVDCSRQENCKKKVPVSCSCGRRTQKALCNSIPMSNETRKLDCDDECVEGVNSLTAEEMAAETARPVQLHDSSAQVCSISLIWCRWFYVCNNECGLWSAPSKQAVLVVERVPQ